MGSRLVAVIDVEVDDRDIKACHRIVEIRVFCSNNYERVAYANKRMRIEASEI